MSRLNRKHLARVNQQLSGQPRQAPDGCAQPKGVGMWCFPLSLWETQLPWSVNQALACHTLSQPMLAKTFLQATAGGCILFSHCFDGMPERDRQEGGANFPTTGVCRPFLSVWITFSVIFISKWEGMGRMLATG